MVKALPAETGLLRTENESAAGSFSPGRRSKSATFDSKALRLLGLALRNRSRLPNFHQFQRFAARSLDHCSPGVAQPIWLLQKRHPLAAQLRDPCIQIDNA